MKPTSNMPEWIVCPSCGCYAYWDGSTYFCDQCGWSVEVDEDE